MSYRRPLSLSWLVLAVAVLFIGNLQGAAAQPDVPPLPSPSTEDSNFFIENILSVESATNFTQQQEFIIEEDAGASLELQLQVAKEKAKIGDTLQFTLTISNTGNSPLSGYTLSLPSVNGLVFSGSGIIAENNEQEFIVLPSNDIQAGAIQVVEFTGEILNTVFPEIDIIAIGSAPYLPHISEARVTVQITDALPENAQSFEMLSLASSSDEEKGSWQPHCVNIE